MTTEAVDALHDRVANDFVLHPIAPDSPAADAADELRALFGALAHGVVDMTPAGREQSLALTKLEEGLFFAIAAIARKEPAK